MATEIKIDVTQVVANLDAVTDGAASRFFARTGEVLTPIKADAAAKWPKRTGKAAAGFKLEAKATATQLRASLANDEGKWPVYKQVWSRYTAEFRDDFRAKYVNDAVSRAESKGRSPAQNRVTEERAERAMDRLMGVGKYKGAGGRHWGEVPPAGFAKKLPWHWLVRRPGQAASGALVADLQADMLALARGA